MIECPYCGHKNIDGTLFCESCGINMLADHSEEISTRQLENENNQFSLKSGWGTATFQEANQVIIHVQDASNPIVLTLDDEALIGRQDPATNHFPDLDLTPYGALENGVSRQHAILKRGEDVLSIIDLNSANGTFLNGQKLSPERPRLLRDGDEIRLGKLTLHIYFK